MDFRLGSINKNDMAKRDYSEDEDFYSQGFERKGVLSVWLGLEVRRRERFPAYFWRREPDGHHQLVLGEACVSELLRRRHSVPYAVSEDPVKRVHQAEPLLPGLRRHHERKDADVPRALRDRSQSVPGSNGAAGPEQVASLRFYL